jgi:hypothetical protein
MDKLAIRKYHGCCGKGDTSLRKVANIGTYH